MKFSAFSDLHHHPGVFRTGTYEDWHFIRDRAVAAGAEFIIHAGDLCHGPSIVPDFVAEVNASPIPVYHCLGNHDSDRTSCAETLAAYHMPDGHYFFDHGGYRFVICDPNYYCVDGEYVHYDLGNYFKFGEYRDYMPPDQLAWLEETIADAPHPCILISHESFERPDGVKNRADVLAIIDAANKRRPHRVLMCINGHHHRDNLRILRGVLYWDLNSTAYEWVSPAHDKFPDELAAQYRCLRNTLMYNDPVHAIVTLEGTTITIEGMESTMFMGIGMAEIGRKLYDAAGRPVTPAVQSVKLTL